MAGNYILLDLIHLGENFDVNKFYKVNTLEICEYSCFKFLNVIDFAGSCSNSKERLYVQYPKSSDRNERHDR